MKPALPYVDSIQLTTLFCVCVQTVCTSTHCLVLVDSRRYRYHYHCVPDTRQALCLLELDSARELYTKPALHRPPLHAAGYFKSTAKRCAYHKGDDTLYCCYSDSIMLLVLALLTMWHCDVPHSPCIAI
jgi:hypothetical protein